MNKKLVLKSFKEYFKNLKNEKDIIEKQSKLIYELKETIKHLTKNQRKIEIKPIVNKNIFRFAVIGDTQFGSAYEQIEQLKAFYDILEQRKINTVFHTGDVLDGWKVYKGQEFELHAHGWEEQSLWFQKIAPKKQNIKTYFITGNHDASFKKIAGIVVGENLAKLRPDWKYIGPDIGDITFKINDDYDFKLRLIHPSGGTAYALSYHPQKLIEKMTYEEKPDLIAIGHYHKAEFIPNYCGISCIQSGCFQKQTPYMATKGLHAMVGGWIVEVYVQKYNINKYMKSIKTEFIQF